MKTRLTFSLAAMAIVSTSVAFGAATYTTGFESDTLGAINQDPGPPGSTWWRNPNATSTGTYTNAASHSGNNSLLVGRVAQVDPLPQNGPLLHVVSPTFAESATEAGPNTRFVASYWMRTVSESNIAVNNAVSVSQSLYSNDRQSYFLLRNNGTNLYAEAWWTDNNVTIPGNTNILSEVLPGAGNLTWGAWYRVETTVDFNPGADNDVATYSIYDSSNSLLGSLTRPTWEPRMDFFGVPDAPVDRFLFRASGSTQDVGLVYIDDVSFAVMPVPEPSSLALAGVGIIGLVSARRARRRIS